MYHLKSKRFQKWFTTKRYKSRPHRAIQVLLTQSIMTTYNMPLQETALPHWWRPAHWGCPSAFGALSSSGSKGHVQLLRSSARRCTSYHSVRAEAKRIYCIRLSPKPSGGRLCWSHFDSLLAPTRTGGGWGLRRSAASLLSQVITS